MRQTFAIAMLLLAGSSCWAADRQVVPAAQLIAAAQTALQGKAAAAHVAAQFASVGHIDDLQVAWSGAIDLRTDIEETWLRARIGVPVQVYVGDRRASSVTVWFAITAPVQAMVYSAAYPKGATTSDVHARSGSVDLARTHGVSMTAIQVVSGQRLRRAVDAGDPVLPTDFEAVPDVQAQQPVRIETIHGSVRLSTTGRALADGHVGQSISVLPAGATEPVHARVESSQVVTVEN